MHHGLSCQKIYSFYALPTVMCGAFESWMNPGQDEPRDWLGKSSPALYSSSLSAMGSTCHIWFEAFFVISPQSSLSSV